MRTTRSERLFAAKILRFFPTTLRKARRNHHCTKQIHSVIGVHWIVHTRLKMPCTSGGFPVVVGSRLIKFRGPTKRMRILCNANNNETHEKTISTLRNTQRIKDWKAYLTQSFANDDEKHKQAVQQAIQTDAALPLSFGFSAGGCLFPFYIGVAGALQDAKILNDNTKLGGSSGTFSP